MEWLELEGNMQGYTAILNMRNRTTKTQSWTESADPFPGMGTFEVTTFTAEAEMPTTL